MEGVNARREAAPAEESLHLSASGVLSRRIFGKSTIPILRRVDIFFNRYLSFWEMLQEAHCRFSLPALLYCRILIHCLAYFLTVKSCDKIDRALDTAIEICEGREGLMEKLDISSPICTLGRRAVAPNRA